MLYYTSNYTDSAVNAAVYDLELDIENGLLCGWFLYSYIPTSLSALSTRSRISARRNAEGFRAESDIVFDYGCNGWLSGF